MQNPFKTHLIFSLPAKYKAGFEADIFRSTFLPTQLVGWVILAFEALMIFLSLSRGAGLATNASRRVHFALYLILFFVTLVGCLACLIFKKELKQRPALFTALTVVYAFIICLWGSFLSAYSHHSTPDISVFIYVILCVSVLIVLRPWQAALLFGVNQLAFYLFMLLYLSPGVDPFSSRINSLITTLLCILISVLLYRSRVRDYVNRITILQQNREISKINEQLGRLVLIDELTQANNRRYLEEVMPRQLQQARDDGLPVCIMMVDFDYFKQYNDLYGHQAGDRCMTSFSRIVNDFFKTREHSFVRYGGEEFVIFLYGADEGDGVKAAEALRRLVLEERIPHTGNETGYFTVSIGLRVVHPDSTLTVQQLVSDADQALYVAKNSGRNRVKLFYAPHKPSHP
ncbi:MAG: GGDEF domain-containing protein [Oscillospiraceae bacterium]